MIIIYRAAPEQYPQLIKNETRCQLIDTCLDVTIAQHYTLQTNMRSIGSENTYSYLFPRNENNRVYSFNTQFLNDNDEVLCELQSLVQEKQEAKETALQAAENGYSAQVMEVSNSNYEVQLMNPPEHCTKLITTVRYSENVSTIDTMKRQMSFKAPLLTLLDTNNKMTPRRFVNYPNVAVNAEFDFTIFIRSFSNIDNFKCSSHDDLNIIEEDNRNFIVKFNHPISWTERQKLGPVKMTMEVDKVNGTVGYVQNVESLPSAPVFKATFGETSSPVKLSLAIGDNVEANMSTASSRNYMFLVDRSDSMQGAAIENCRKALNLLLSSLPENCTFNICSFGSHHSFLFGKEFGNYNEKNLKRARELVGRMGAYLGGTKLLEPLKKVIKMHDARMKEAPNSETVVFLLTDGAVRDTENVINVVKDGVQQNKNEWKLRFFTLGIGKEVSVELVERVANEGGGSSIFLMKNERLNRAVAKQMKQVLCYPFGDIDLEFSSKYAQLSRNKLLGPMLLDSKKGKCAYPGTDIGSGYELIDFKDEFRAAAESEVIATLISKKTGVVGEVKVLAEIRKQDLEYVEVNLFGEIIHQELKHIQASGKIVKSAKKRITKLAICANIATEYTSLVSVSKQKTNEATEEDEVMPPLIFAVHRRPRFCNRYQGYHGGHMLHGMGKRSKFGGAVAVNASGIPTRRIKKRKGKIIMRASKMTATALAPPPPAPGGIMFKAKSAALVMDGEEESMSDASEALVLEEKSMVKEVFRNSSFSEANNIATKEEESESFDFAVDSVAANDEVTVNVSATVDLSELYEKLDGIVTFQASNGSFEVEVSSKAELLKTIEVNEFEYQDGLLTALVVVFLQTRLSALQEEWAMVASKAKNFLSTLPEGEEKLLEVAKGMLA